MILTFQIEAKFFHTTHKKDFRFHSYRKLSYKLLRHLGIICYVYKMYVQKITVYVQIYLAKNNAFHLQQLLIYLLLNWN